MFCFAVAVVYCFADLIYMTNGDYVFEGPCPIITPLPQSEIQDLTGPWFIMYRTSIQNPLKCDQNIFVKSNENYNITGIAIAESSNTPVVLQYYFKKSETPDHNFDVLFDNNPNNSRPLYVIRSTNLTFNLVSCAKINETHSEFSLIVFKRVPCVSKVEYELYQREFLASGVPQEFLKPTVEVSYVGCIRKDYVPVPPETAKCNLETHHNLTPEEEY